MPWIAASVIAGAVVSAHQQQFLYRPPHQPYWPITTLIDEVTSETDEEDVFLKLKGYVCVQTLTFGTDDPVRKVWRLYQKEPKVEIV